jgi:amino acid permease
MPVRPTEVPLMTVLNPAEPSGAEPTGKNELSRSLKRRHLTMISIGGIIGAGLFVGSSTSIIAGGPASMRMTRRIKKPQMA